jgi:hypothetical protein
LRVIRCPTLQVSQFLFPGQRSDTFLTDHVYIYDISTLRVNVTFTTWRSGGYLSNLKGRKYLQLHVYEHKALQMRKTTDRNQKGNQVGCTHSLTKDNPFLLSRRKAPGQSLQ